MERAIPQPDSVPNPEDEFPARHASIVLIAREGRVLERLPEIPVAPPWWPDIAAVVDAVREAFGLDVVVLRMLDSERPRPHGGLVTYLAEVDEAAVGSPSVAAVL